MTDPRNDTDLQALFDAARPGAMPDDLFARIMADAAAQTSARRAPVVRRHWLAGLGAALGGWASVAGLATAALAGVWIGVAQPVALDGFGFAPRAEAAHYDLDDLMPGFDILASED